MVRIHPSAIATLAVTLARCLPTSVRSWVEACFPEWFLPERVVLKTHKRGDVEDEIANGYIDTEIEAYRRLTPVQGLLIPRCFGEARYNGARALVIEDVGGHSLESPEGALLTIEELAPMLQECYRGLRAFGVGHGDPLPGNFHIVQGRIIALDLEMAEFDPPTEKLELRIGTDTENVLEAYSRNRKVLRSEGLLEAA